MSTYAEKLAASRAAWLAYLTKLDEYKEIGWSDDTSQDALIDAVDTLWEAYKTARADLGGAY